MEIIAHFQTKDCLLIICGEFRDCNPIQIRLADGPSGSYMHKGKRRGEGNRHSLDIGFHPKRL